MSGLPPVPRLLPLQGMAQYEEGYDGDAEFHEPKDPIPIAQRTILENRDPQDPIVVQRRDLAIQELSIHCKKLNKRDLMSLKIFWGIIEHRAFGNNRFIGEKKFTVE